MSYSKNYSDNAKQSFLFSELQSRKNILAAKGEHITDDSETCWCDPEVIVMENGSKIFIHREFN